MTNCITYFFRYHFTDQKYVHELMNDLHIIPESRSEADLEGEEKGAISTPKIVLWIRQ